jgi:hypothetical protein
VLVDCLGTNNSFSKAASEEDELVTMLEYFPRQMVVFVISLSDPTHGFDGYTQRLLRKVLAQGGLIAPIFVFTHYHELKKKWKDPEYQRKQESESNITSISDELEDFFRKFLEKLKNEEWDTTFYATCVDANHALDLEHVDIPDLESSTDDDSDDDSDDSDEESRSDKKEEARWKRKKALKEEQARRKRRLVSREAVGTFWRELIGRSAAVGKQQADKELANGLQLFITETVVKNERVIRKEKNTRLIVPTDMHELVRKENHEQTIKFDHKVRTFYPVAGLNKDEKYTEDGLVDGIGLKSGLVGIIKRCIKRAEKEGADGTKDHSSYSAYIETCAKECLEAFAKELQTAMREAQKTSSNELRDASVGIAFDAVDSTEYNALTKRERLEQEKRKKWAAHQFDLLSPFSATSATFTAHSWNKMASVWGRCVGGMASVAGGIGLGVSALGFGAGTAVVEAGGVYGVGVAASTGGALLFPVAVGMIVLGSVVWLASDIITGEGGYFTYAQAKPEIYDLCIKHVMQGKEDIVSSVIKETSKINHQTVEKFLVATFPFKDKDSWFDSYALLEEFVARDETRSEQAAKRADVRQPFLHGEEKCRSAYAAALKPRSAATPAKQKMSDKKKRRDKKRNQKRASGGASV